MDDPTVRFPQVSPGEPTIDNTPQMGAGITVHGLSEDAPPCCARVALVEGSGPRLTGEIATLLHRRLRLAATLLFFALLVFLPQHAFKTDFSRPGSGFLFGFHITNTFALGVLSGLLLTRRQMPIWQLRLAELLTFALPMTFLVAVQHFAILRRASELAQIAGIATCEAAQLTMPAGLCLFLVFTYALFVPNTWRRAAVVIGILAMTPVLVNLAIFCWYPQVRQFVPPGELTGFGLIMVVAAVTALFGVDTIGSLRQEAFEARQLGQYRLTRRIGAGGMGEVYLAEHQMLKRPCVVKLIRPDKAGDRRVLARFQREVRATAKLSHWNTIEIFDYGSTEDGTFYYVMEYLPGMSLAELVERFGPLPPERAVHFLRQICDALSEAHAAGLIHRDIKPGNIFAAQRGGVYDVAKLLDFGLVKPAPDQEAIHLTGEGMIAGSPLFMSPEQATGDGAPDARSDIYSLGAVGYYLLTGRPPFEGKRAIKVMIAHAHQDVIPPSQHRDGIPDDVQQVVLQCLAKAPADRYQNAASLAEALARCTTADRWTREDARRWWKESG